jgi:hypothetical protein
VRRWALLLLGGLVALALAGQLLLPRFAERRVARDIGRSADVQRTTVRSVPALKLLWNRADRVEVVMTETRAGPARLAELLHDARGVNELDTRAARARLGTVMLRDLRIEKRGDDVRARATLADADLAAALPPGLTARAGAAPNGELMLEAGPSVGGLRLPVQAQARLVARDGAVVIAPDGLLTGLASLTVFSDPNLQVTGLEARRRTGGYDITARGRLAGA